MIRAELFDFVLGVPIVLLHSPVIVIRNCKDGAVLPHGHPGVLSEIASRFARVKVLRFARCGEFGEGFGLAKQ